MRAVQQLAFFEGLGAVILFLGSAAIGRLSLRSHRDVVRAQRQVENENGPTGVGTAPPTA